ncbi:MAG: hypothetical protein MZV64_42300 [Ignavibacteriales bacterium]|nr:hypothetical protein [Ignavibacteriales bacterium]
MRCRRRAPGSCAGSCRPGPARARPLSGRPPRAPRPWCRPGRPRPSAR